MIHVRRRPLLRDRLDPHGRHRTCEISAMGAAATAHAPDGISRSPPPDVQVQAHAVLRLRGRGLAWLGGGSRDGLDLRIGVHIPGHLSAKERHPYERIRAMAKGDRRQGSGK